ncbi:MAG: NADH-quinone oxidoreductase subunit H, partial [Planctomycetaceae bacterium]
MTPLAVIGILVKILIVVGITQGAVAYLIWVERKVAAYAQDRIGPNRAGREFGIPLGLLQPL